MKQENRHRKELEKIIRRKLNKSEIIFFENGFWRGRLHELKETNSQKLSTTEEKQ